MAIICLLFILTTTFLGGYTVWRWWMFEECITTGEKIFSVVEAILVAPLACPIYMLLGFVVMIGMIFSSEIRDEMFSFN